MSCLCRQKYAGKRVFFQQKINQQFGLGSSARSSVSQLIGADKISEDKNPSLCSKVMNKGNLVP